MHSSGSIPGQYASVTTIGAVLAGDGVIRVSFHTGRLGSGTLTNHTADRRRHYSHRQCASPILVTGLTSGTSYTCKAKTTTSGRNQCMVDNSSSVTPVAGPVSLTNVALAANGGVASASSAAAGFAVSAINNNERQDAGIQPT